jgi:methionyl aminopeptidase
MLKSAEQIARLRDAGRLVAEIYERLDPFIVPGVTTDELDRRAEFEHTIALTERGTEILTFL